ncbi:hypothetical protein N2152v2_005096 [Parachlorella kessleri]
MLPARLAVQSFSGNTLIRGLAPGSSLEGVLEEPGQSFLLVAERKVCVSQQEQQQEQNEGGRTQTVLRWFDLQQLRQQLHFRQEGADQFRLSTGEGADVAIPIYLLGKDATGACKLAADVSKVPQAALEERQLGFKELRSLMALLDPGQLAVAGHAVALSSWHQAHQFCSRCGAPTSPVEGGGRRQCTAHKEHRAYPRTDPVVIMLVESPDGRRALLGKYKRMQGPMYTALAGFIDQGESVEEAVTREVREESGVEVTQVDILGSQPWPIGRGGSCELMIGCIAKAHSEDLSVDYNEMEDIQWMDRSDVLAAVEVADRPSNPYGGGKGDLDGGQTSPRFWIPPSFAIAHHLIKAWAQHGASWFGEGSGRQGGQSVASSL